MKTALKRLLVGLVVWAIALSTALASGCGGENRSTPDVGNPLSRVEFARRATEICERQRSNLRREARVLVERQSRPKPHSALVALVARYVLLPAIELESAGIAKLSAPTRDRDQIDRILRNQEQAVNRVAVRGKIPSLLAVYRPFARSGDLFRDYGIPGCANGPRPSVSAIPGL